MSLAVLRPWLTLITIISTFAVNAWSNIDPINGESIGQISNTVFREVLITPANYAFIIWGLIYVGLLAFGIYQVLPNQRQRQDLNVVRHALIVSSIIQGGWVFLFLYRLFWGSLAAMVGILAALVWGYGQFVKIASKSRRDRWFVTRPFSVYLGWISVATIVNVAIAFYSHGWTQLGWTASSWTMVMLVVATLLGCAMVCIYRNTVFAGVFVWAFVAIAVQQYTSLLIPGVALLGVILLVGTILVTNTMFTKPMAQDAPQDPPEVTPPTTPPIAPQTTAQTNR